MRPADSLKSVSMAARAIESLMNFGLSLVVAILSSLYS